MSCSCLGCSVHGECPECHGRGITYRIPPDAELVSYFGEDPWPEPVEMYCDCPRGQARMERESRSTHKQC